MFVPTTQYEGCFHHSLHIPAASHFVVWPVPMANSHLCQSKQTIVKCVDGRTKGILVGSRGWHITELSLLQSYEH